MAELSLMCPSTTASSASINVNRRVLTRIGDIFPANTTLNVDIPGVGWAITGDTVTWSGVAEFTDDTQVYLNGQHLFTAPNASVNNDVYFVSSDFSIAFESDLKTNDIVQFWKFTASG